jgi:hypothetical protein
LQSIQQSYSGPLRRVRQIFGGNLKEIATRHRDDPHLLVRIPEPRCRAPGVCLSSRQKRNRPRFIDH